MLDSDDDILYNTLPSNDFNIVEGVVEDNGEVGISE